MNLSAPPPTPVVVVISADAEWRAVGALFPEAAIGCSPLGEWFLADPGTGIPALFFHGGWGKIAAAASTQYLIDHAAPGLIVNLGTCGGFGGSVERGTVILVERTVVYDIIEQMGDPEAAIAHYTTTLDLSWLGDDYPHPVHRTHLLSGDRDLLAGELPMLREKFGGMAGDWESGAIAYVAARNGVRLLILRGVSDLVGEDGGEAYGNIEIFHQSTETIMARLIAMLPAWLRRAGVTG